MELSELTIDQLRRLEHITQAMNEIEPSTPRNWRNCLLDLIGQDGSVKAADIFPHTHYFVPTSFSSEREQRKRRQLRLYTFNKVLNHSSLRSLGEPEKKVEDYNTRCKAAYINYFDNIRPMEAIKNATKDSFVAMFQGKTLQLKEEKATWKPLLAEMTKAGRKADRTTLENLSHVISKRGGELVSAVSQVAVENAPDLNGLVVGVGDQLLNLGQTLAQSAPGANNVLELFKQSETVVRMFEPLLKDLGMTFGDALNMLKESSPDLFTSMAKFSLENVPGIAHAMIGPALAKDFSDAGFRAFQLARNRYDTQFIFLGDAINAQANAGLTTFLTNEATAAGCKLGFTVLKAGSLATDGVLPGVGQAVNTAVVALEGFAQMLRYAYNRLDDLRQIRQANELLKQTLINPEVVFKEAPILVCYYIFMIPTSCLLAKTLFDKNANVNRESHLLFQDWQNEVASNREAVGRLKDHAARIINAGRIEIPGYIVLASDAADKEKKFWDKLMDLVPKFVSYIAS